MTLRYAILIGAMVLGVHAPDVWRHATESDLSHQDAGHNVVLVVSDGTRWQEVFRGADSALLFSDAGSPNARNRYWRGTVAERRR